MKYLSFFLFTVQFWCISQSDLRDFLAKKEYSKIVKSFKRNPGAFQNAARLNILGQAQMKVGQAKQAVKSCAKAMLKKPYKQCASILRDLRKKNLEVYDSSLAEFYYQNGDDQAAFSKYFRLYRKYPKNEEYMVGLIQIMMSLDHLDTAQELVWLLDKTNKKSAHYRGLLKLRLSVLKRELANSDKVSTLDSLSSSYKILFLSQERIQPFFDVLFNHYESVYKDSKLDLGDLELMYLANLYFLKEDYSSVREIIDSYGKSLVEPRAQISLESLLSRLPKQSPETLINSEDTSPDNIDFETTSKPNQPSQSKQVDARFVPLDLSELDLATPGDLSAFEKLSEDYFNRMKEMKTQAQERWLYEQVNNKFFQMWSHHMDPSKHAFAAFQESQKGQALLSDMGKRQATYKKLDKQNSKMFAGRLSKIDSSLNSTTDRETKIKILRDFRRNWSFYQNSSNPALKGAWDQYLRSDEGKSLLNRVKRELSEHNLTNGRTISTGVSRKYQ